MKQYLQLLRDIKFYGRKKTDRTGTGTISLFGHQSRYNLKEGFPLVTTKKMHLKSIIYELLWFLRGDTNIQYLNDNGVKIWNEWADENGDLGPIYGEQWRKWQAFDWVPGHFEGYEWYQGEYKLSMVDQIQNVINTIKRDPDSRRLIVSAWDVGRIDKMKLPPCHCLFQFNVMDGKLSCQLYQRSCDAFLGVPFNIASYALLTMMIAQICRLGVGDFIHTYGDVHIYKNHLKAVNEQLGREPFPLPKMKINNKVDNIDNFKFEDFELLHYECHPAIKAPIAV